MRAAFQIMGITEGQDTKDAKYILKRLEADGRTEISKRDLIRLCAGRFEKAEVMDAGLSVKQKCPSSVMRLLRLAELVT